MTAGRKPFGHKPGELKVVRLIWRKRKPRKGEKVATFLEIAKELNAEGYRTRTGLKWYSVAVQNVWERAYRDSKKTHHIRGNYGPGDYLSDVAIGKCLTAGSGQVNLIFRILLGTGLRAGELVGLRRRDVCLDKGDETLHIKYAKNTRGDEIVKTYKERWVHISEEIGELLRRYINSRIPALRAGQPLFVNTWGNPLTYKNLYSRIKMLGRKADVEGLKPHRCRHSYATTFLNSNGSIANLQTQLGHQDYQTTRIYAKSLKTVIKKDVEAVQKRLNEIEADHTVRKSE